ncbi:MAG: WD40 repeat domain-containing serine/threonine protein kinase, partial [Verrucomicrobiota bacterium]
QALALMDHPNIARVLDAGRTGKGRPFFVMELVVGVPITRFCDENKLTTQKRLELFIPVCRAIHHAHQKGIVHRDIKPSNIMVTLHDGAPVPKVIDFGVAKALEAPLTEKTMFTNYGQMVGTPDYMSPEQAEMTGVDIDTRSDIYSLGVLLYEILTGFVPLAVQKVALSGMMEMLRLIRDQDPPTPSTRLNQSKDDIASISARRSTSSRRLRDDIRGELDWIVMKALEKDRNRRYESANNFARDIERFLDHRPLEASPPSPLYRTRKFIQRHRVGVAFTSCFILVAVGILVAAIWAATFFKEQETRQRELAEEKSRLALNNRLARQEAEEERDRVYAENYLSDMRVAQQDWNNSHVPRMYGLLARYLPGEGHADLRRWEWYYLVSLLRQDIKTLHEDYQSAYRVRWHPSGTWFGASSRNEHVTIRNSEDYALHKTIHSAGRWAFDWSHDGRRLATISRNRRIIRIWDWQTGEIVKTIRPKIDVPLNMAWAPDDRFLAGKGKHFLMVIEVDTGNVMQHWRSTELLDLSWSHDGRWISQIGDVREAATGRKLNGIRFGLHMSCSAFHPLESRLALAYESGTVQVVAPDTGAVLVEWETDNPVIGMTWSPDGSSLLTLGQNRRLSIWNPADGRLIQQFQGHHDRLLDAAWSPDGQKILSADAGGVLKIWRIGPDETLAEELASAAEPSPPPEWPRFAGVYLPANRLAEVMAVSPDGARAAGRPDGLLGIWDMKTGQLLHPLIGHVSNFAVGRPSWNHDGSLLATGSADNFVIIWKVETGQRV